MILLPRLALVAILFSALFAGLGCPPPARPDSSAYVSVDRTLGESSTPDSNQLLRSENGEANQRFAGAVALWDEGSYRDAEQAFRLFGVDFPNDLLSPVAEAYLGRTLLALDAYRDARVVFESLAGRPEIAARNSGMLYLAFADEVQSGRAAAVETLATRTRSLDDLFVPATLLVKGDAPVLGMLLFRTSIANSRPLVALEALSAIHQYTDDTELRQWAVGAGSNIVRNDLNGQQLVDCLSFIDREMAASPDLPVGLCGAVLVERYVVTGDRESAAIAMERGGQAMMRAGLEDIFAQSNRLLSATGDDQSLRYAVVLSLTGPDQRAGRAALGGVLLATRAFERGENVSEVMIEDTQGSVETTRSATLSAIERGAKLIIGPLEPSLAAQARAVASEHGVPFISLAATYSEDGSPAASGQRAWELGFNPSAEATAIAEELVRRGATGGAVIVGSGRSLPYLRAFQRAVVVELAERQISVTLTTELSGEGSEQEQARAVARQIVNQRPAIVIFATTAAETATLTAWLADSGLWAAGSSGGRSSSALFFADSFAWGQDLLRNSQPYVQGMMIPVWFDTALPRRQAEFFTQAFERVYGRAPSAVEAFAYDAASVARALLVEEGLRSRERIAERLQQDVNFEGVTGLLNFGASVTSVVTPGIWQVSGERLREVGVSE